MTPLELTNKHSDDSQPGLLSLRDSIMTFAAVAVKLICKLLLWRVVAVAVAGAEVSALRSSRWTAATLPNPITDPKACGATRQEYLLKLLPI